MKKITYYMQAAVCVLLVIFDQLTKHWARTQLKNGPKVLIEGVFSFSYLENRGSIWGILQGKVDILLLFSIILFALLLYVYFRMPKTKFYLPLLWVIPIMCAGAIGNSIDRLVFGYVTDFLYFELINFPIFNVADCYITVCAFFTVFLIFTKYKEDEFSFLSFKRKDAEYAAKSDADKT